MNMSYIFDNNDKTIIGLDLDCHHVLGNKITNRGFSKKTHRREVVRKVKGYGRHHWQVLKDDRTPEVVEPQVYHLFFNEVVGEYTCVHPRCVGEGFTWDEIENWVSTIFGFEQAQAKMGELKAAGYYVHYIY